MCLSCVKAIADAATAAWSAMHSVDTLVPAGPAAPDDWLLQLDAYLAGHRAALGRRLAGDVDDAAMRAYLSLGRQPLKLEVPLLGDRVVGHFLLRFAREYFGFQAAPWLRGVQLTPAYADKDPVLLRMLADLAAGLRGQQGGEVEGDAGKNDQEDDDDSPGHTHVTTVQLGPDQAAAVLRALGVPVPAGARVAGKMVSAVHLSAAEPPPPAPPQQHQQDQQPDQQPPPPPGPPPAET